MTELKVVSSTAAEALYVFGGILLGAALTFVCEYPYPVLILAFLAFGFAYIGTKFGDEEIFHLVLGIVGVMAMVSLLLWQLSHSSEYDRLAWGMSADAGLLFWTSSMIGIVARIPSRDALDKTS